MRGWFCATASLSVWFASPLDAAELPFTDENPLRMPVPGSHQLRVLAPTLLELTLINTKAPDPGRVTQWDLVNTNLQFQAPLLSEFVVTADGRPAVVLAAGFKRRPLYAPLARRDLRIANQLYLQLVTPIADNEVVEVKNPGAGSWPATWQFIATADPLRYSPAVHVNQVGYVPAFPKKAMVGYYLGTLGELEAWPTLGFRLVEARTGGSVYEGLLTPRPDSDYNYTPTPYQKVLEADFSGFTTPGEYESNVLPNQGDPQVVWPKTTSVTAAAVAALAQSASSPRFKEQFPEAASNYLARAQLGWSFLTNAITRYGKDGAYQKITHYGDEFMHDDELAWAACELFLATGDEAYHETLKLWFDPASPATWRWGWWRLFEAYGHAIRSYAFAARSGRLPTNQLDSAFLAKCEAQILAAANDALASSRLNAYGSSFSVRDKQGRTAGWYFSGDNAFDVAVAYLVDSRPEYFDARRRHADD